MMDTNKEFLPIMVHTECPIFPAHTHSISVKKLVTSDCLMLASEAQKKKIENTLAVVKAEDF